MRVWEFSKLRGSILEGLYYLWVYIEVPLFWEKFHMMGLHKTLAKLSFRGIRKGG